MKVSKDVFLENISKLDKLLPLQYKDYLNYDSAFYVDNYPIDVIRKNINCRSFFSYYCNGNRYLAAREDWLKSISFDYKESVWNGNKVIQYIERYYQPDKPSKKVQEFLWSYKDKFIVLLMNTSIHRSSMYVGRSYLINQIVKRFKI